MGNLQLYQNAFFEAFELSEGTDLNDLKYQTIEAWDSIGHLTLISNLEIAFEITLDMDDVVDFSSFEKGKQIMLKYAVEL